MPQLRDKSPKFNSEKKTYGYSQRGIAHILVLLLLLLALPIGLYLVQHPQIFKPKAAVSETGEIQWLNQKYTIGGNGTYSVDSYNNDHYKSLDEDVVITGIRIDLTGMHDGLSVQEFCGDFFRDTPPKYEPVIGGYSEFICWGFTKLPEQPTDWHTFVDLSDTPLYFPKDSKVVFGANASNFDSSNIQNLTFNMTLNYKKYHPGDPRYRSLRLPYADQLDDYTTGGGGRATPVYYIPERGKTLHVKGAYLYPQPITRYDTNHPQTACIRWLDQGGGIASQECFYNNQVIGPSSAHYQPQKLSLDWNIAYPYLLSNYCQTSQPGVDCAMWAFVEIPSSIPVGPEAIFRDFNNIPRSYLKQYCENQAKTGDYPYGYTHTYFCDGASSCPKERMVNNCLYKLFPYASCQAGQNCQSLKVSPPEEWAKGETKTYGLQVTNNTLQTWNASGANAVTPIIYISKEEGDFERNRSALTFNNAPKKATVSLPRDLGPGESATIQVSIQSPDVAGYYILHHQLVKQGVGFFDEVIKNTILVTDVVPASTQSSTPPADVSLSAQYTPNNIPQSAFPNSNLTYSILVKNTGTETWHSSGSNQTNLIAYIGSENSTPSNALAISTVPLLYDLPPGGSLPLQVNLKVPSSPGNYFLFNQMVKQGQAVFPQTNRNQFTVSAPASQPRAASYTVTSHNLVSANSNINLDVTVKNEGNQKWLANSPVSGSAMNEAQLIVYISNSNNNDPGLYSSAFRQLTIKLPHDVNPNETINLTANISAPSNPGDYFIHYRMIEQGVAWFNQYATTNLAVR